MNKNLGNWSYKSRKLNPCLVFTHYFFEGNHYQGSCYLFHHARAWGLSVCLSPQKLVLSPPMARKSTLYSKKSVIFRPKFSTSKCLNFGICHSLRGLTYMSVFSSSSIIRIYYSHNWIIPGIKPLPLRRSSRVCYILYLIYILYTNLFVVKMTNNHKVFINFLVVHRF